MPGLFDYLVGRLTGKRTSDIDLPSESGEIDPRLPKTGKAMREAFDTANDYASGLGSPTERLKAAGRRAVARSKSK